MDLVCIVYPGIVTFLSPDKNECIFFYPLRSK